MTPPQRRTVAEIAAPYANFLVPMPYVEPGVCVVCRCGVDPAFARCWKCGRERLGVGRGGADVVAMISLAPQRLAGGGRAQLSYELVNYKRPLTSATLRGHFTLGLAAVLWTWLSRHEQCVARAAGVDHFPVVTTVPSSSSGRTGAHPLVTLVSGIVVGSADRYQDLLVSAPTTVGQREFTDDRYVARARLSGEPVLVIDDTWTTGAHAHGAAAALKAAGAGPVGVVAIGRWYHPEDSVNAVVERHLKARRWSWDECMLDR